MRAEYHRFLLLFVDGVGLAPATPHNPFAEAESPVLGNLLGGPMTLEQMQHRRSTEIDAEVFLGSLDATLEVAGLPQSATGQTALFTGVNAAGKMGRHVTGFPGPQLREIIADESVFRRARERSCSVTFANVYSPAYLEAIGDGTARRSVTTCAVQAADVPFRSIAKLEEGDGVTWDIERDFYGQSSGVELPRISASIAGGHLARLAARHDLTVFETFLPDMVGHGRIRLPAGEVVRRLDGLIEGVLADRTPETTLLVTSDHGNFEDRRVRTHSRCPVPLLAVGPAAEAFADLTSITELTPRLLQTLQGSAEKEAF